MSDRLQVALAGIAVLCITIAGVLIAWPWLSRRRWSLTHRSMWERHRNA